LGQAILPAVLTLIFKNTASLFPQEEEHFVCLDNVKRTIFVIQTLYDFCEMRSILDMKFDALKMTVGNADFWNEAKLKRD